VKSIPLDKGQSYYKIGQTGRLETYLAKLKKEPLFSKDTTPLVVKVWGGASYFIKVIRRIFRDKRISPAMGGNGWYALSDDDVSWLSKLRIAETANIESAVYDIFDKSDPLLISRLRKEGLW